jgi:hypothetical protein
MEATFQATRITEREIHIPNIMCLASENRWQNHCNWLSCRVTFKVKLASVSSSLPRFSSRLTDPGHHSGTSIQATINIILFVFDFIYTTIHVVNTSSIVTHIIPN